MGRQKGEISSWAYNALDKPEGYGSGARTYHLERAHRITKPSDDDEDDESMPLEAAIFIAFVAFW